MSENERHPDSELTFGYTPKRLEEGYKPRQAVASAAASNPPKPPTGKGAGSTPAKE